MTNKQKIEISNQNEVFYLLPDTILYVEADGNYCDIHLTDGDVLESVCFQRAEIARMMDAQLPYSAASKFALLGRTYLINLERIMRLQPSKGALTFDINTPGTCKKQTIKASVKALQTLRGAIKEPETTYSIAPTNRRDVVNGGFTNYIVQKNENSRSYMTEEDEIMILGQK